MFHSQTNIFIIRERLWEIDWKYVENGKSSRLIPSERIFWALLIELCPSRSDELAENDCRYEPENMGKTTYKNRHVK